MTGIRPQAVDRAARILGDFTMDVDGRVIHLLDAPSPGATSSNTLDPKLVAAALGLDPQAPLIYLANRIDPSLLADLTAGPAAPARAEH